MSKKQVTIEELSNEVKLLKEILEKNSTVLEDVLKCVRDTNIKIDLLEQDKYQTSENNRVAPKKLIGKGKAITRKPAKKNKIDEPEESKINDTCSIPETENTLEYEHENQDGQALDVEQDEKIDTLKGHVKIPVKKSIKIAKSTDKQNENNTAAKTNENNTAAKTNENNTAAKTNENNTAAKTNEDNTAAKTNENNTAAKTNTATKITGLNIINAFKLKFKEDENYFNEWLTGAIKEDIKNKSKEEWNKMAYSKKVNLYYNYMKDKHFSVLEALKKSYNK
jgi:hypothetical protein